MEWMFGAPCDLCVHLGVRGVKPLARYVH